MAKQARLFVVPLVAALALSGCATQDPTGSGASGGGSGSAASDIIVGANSFPESEIVAELYAQVLEDGGLTVTRNFGLGPRQQTMPALEDGSITLIPEYTGNLLTYLDESATATTSEDVDAALQTALEDSGLVAFDSAPAQDQDAYVVTSETAEANNLVEIGDLAGMQPFSLAANPQFGELSYGLPGLADAYGITDVDFVQYEDYGGPDTVAALLDGTVDVADIYTTSPAIAENNLVVLEDPESIIAAQNLVPLAAEGIATDDVETLLNTVSAALTTEDLIALRTRVEGSENARPEVAAHDWLVEEGLIDA